MDKGNILEVVLNSDLQAQFNRVDDNLAKIEQHTAKTVEQIGLLNTNFEKFAQIMQAVAQSTSGATKGLEGVASSVERIGSVNTSGIASVSNSLSTIGDVASGQIDALNFLSKLLNEFNVTGLDDSMKALKKTIADINNKLFDDKTIQLSKEEEQTLVNIRQVLEDILKIRNTSTQVKMADDANEMKKAVDEYLEYLRNKNKDAAAIEKQEAKERADAKKKEIEEMTAAWNKYFAEMDAKEKERSEAEKQITDLLKQRQSLLQKQDKAQLNYTEAEQLNKGAAAMAKYQAEYDKYGRGIEEINNKLNTLKQTYKALVVKGEHMFETTDIERQIQFMEQYNVLMMKIRETKMAAIQKKDQEDENTALAQYVNLAKERKSLMQEISGIKATKDAGGIVTPEELTLLTDSEKRITAIETEMQNLANTSVKVMEYSDSLTNSGQKQLEIDREKLAQEKALAKAKEEQADKEAKIAIDELNRFELEIQARQRLAKQRNESFDGSLQYSKNAKTIEQERQAIEYLKVAREKLDTTDKNYDKDLKALNDEISRHEQNIKKATGAQSQMIQNTRQLGDTVRSLAGAFGVAFSAQQLINYAKKIRDVTGEFELQHRAMQAIIQDTDKANKLWDKTIKLAVKSPYSVKELVTYTKQLAAYRIETEKLYDTTKMLADISAGLGVDMNRLILAYGQVKAANYLRGQELRQFSEAGVNILGELANYFTELKGQAVSTGEVFEMVSKRMVKFEDVAEVLKRLTQEGGVFFNMQEIQAETLKGKYMNLQDSLDLMMNKIGEYNKGVFVSFVDTAKYLADNWQTVGNTLKWVSGIVVGLSLYFKTAAINAAVLNAAGNVNAITMRGLSGAIARYIVVARAGEEATRGFSAALSANPIGAVLAALMALIGVVSATVGHYRRLREAQEKLNKIAIESEATLSKMVLQYKEMAEKIRDTSTSEKERTELMQKMKRLYGDILPDRLLNIEYIKKEGNAYGEATKAIAAYYQEQRRQRQIEATEAEYGDKVTTAQEKAAKSIVSQIKELYGYEISLMDANAVLQKMIEELEDGTITADNFRDALSRLIKVQTGYNVDFNKMKIVNKGDFDVEEYAVNLYRIEKWYQRLKEYWSKLDEVSLNARFGDSLIKPVEDMMQTVEDDLKVLPDDLKQFSDDFVQNARDMSAATAREYSKMWENFKENPLYAANKDFYDNYFEVHIKPIIDNAAFDKQEDAVAKSITEFLNKHSVTLKDGLDKLMYDSSKETLDEWFKNVLQPMVEMYEKELRLASQNASLLPIEQITAMAQQLPALKELEAYWKEILDPKKTKGSGGNKALELLNKQIDAIKNAAKQYDEYKKMYDDTEAFDKTKHEVEGLFKELNIGHILKNGKAFDENVIKDNLEVWLAKSIAAAGKGGQQVAEKYISGLQLAFEKENYSKTVIEPFKKAMEDAIDAISMGDELEKLGIGRDFGKIIFGIDTTTTKQMREQVEKWKQDLTASMRFGDEAEKEYRKMIEKIDDMEDKAQKERLKKYIGYMHQAMSERARIQVEGLTELAEIERTFQEEIAKAYKVGDTARVQYLQEMQKAAIEGTRKATDEKLQKQTWEDFKKSSMYTELFSDLENLSTKSLTAMREKLTEMQGTLNNLDPQNLKAIAEEIDKLEDAIVKRNPFKSLVDYWRQWQDIQSKGYTEESIVTGLSQKTKEVEAYTDELAGLEKQLYNLQHVQSDDIGAIDVQSDAYKLQLEMLQKQIQEKKNDINATEEEIRALEKMYEILQKLRNAENTFESEWKKMMGTVKSASDSIIDGLSAFGVETDNTTEAFGTLLDSIIDIIAVLPTYIAGMTAAGVAINSAMGVIGLIAEGVTLVIGLVKAIAGIRDAAITDTIDSYKDKVDALSDSYDRLEKAYDKAWDVQNLVTYRNELQKNIDQQVKYYQAMIAAEQTRKDPDESQIREWKNTINDLFDEKDDAQSKFLEELGGITDFKSAAQEFVDAWADAFSETGDGMEGLRDHFNEVLQNMVKKQAMQRVASHYLTGMFEMIDAAIGDNGMVTPQEMDALRAKFEEIAPQFNAALQAIFESLGIFGDQAEGELSGLQKGIQGVTEETAEILAAYLNSVRYYVIDSNTKLGQLQNILQDNTGMVNPMLAELRSIAQRADDIYNFLFQRRESGTDSMRVFVVNA